MRRPKDGELFSLEWGMITQVSNIMCPDQIGHQMSIFQRGQTQYDALLESKEVENSLLHHVWWWVRI